MQSRMGVIMCKARQAKKALAIAWAAAALTACASNPTHDETQGRVRAAETTLRDFTRDPDMSWFRDHVGQAKALLISPRIVQAGFIFGASGGSAVVIARRRGGDGWSGPAFYHMGSGSVGLQAGAQESETVALIMTDKALNSLLSNSFKLGGDVSVAAGPVGVGAGAPVTADMIVYVRSKGLYGGVNLAGTVIAVDDKGNQAYYGRPATPVDILVTHTVSSPDGGMLAQAASGAVAQGR